MATLTTITGALWPPSGTATAATIGFNAVNTTITHVRADASLLPPGSQATGWLQGADNGTLDFRIDPTGSVMQANETDYWVTYWQMVATNSTALATDGTSCLVLNLQNGGSNVRTDLFIRNSTSNPGLTMDVLANSVGGSAETLFSTGSSGSTAMIPFNRWFHVCIHVKRSTAAGIFEVYINGTLISRQQGLTTDVSIGAAALQAVNFFIQGAAGITHRLCGPIITFDGTGPTLRPLHSLSIEGPLRQWHGCDPGSDTSNQNGKFWTYSLSGVTRTLTTYVSGGNSPNRKRNVWSGSAASTWSATTIDSIGALPWSQFGWSSIVFPMCYFPNGTGQFVVRNSAGSTILTLDVTGGNLQQSAVTKAPWTQADRYALAIHFGANGQLKGSLYDLSQLNSAQNAWSFDLGTWTVGALGTVTMSGVLGASSQETDGMAVVRLVTVVGVDSLSEVFATTVSPNMAIADNTAKAMCEFNDVAVIPDATYAHRNVGMDRRVYMIPIGRGGQTRAQFQTNVLNFLDNARGLEVINFDGGSVNEITGITNEATRVSVLNGLVANLQTMSDQAVARGWLIWLSTMTKRPVGGTWTALQVQAMGDYSNLIRTFAASQQSSAYHIRFSDVASAIADQLSLISGDSTHPTAAGAVTLARAMITSLTTPDQPRLLVSAPPSRGSTAKGNAQARGRGK